MTRNAAAKFGGVLRVSPFIFILPPVDCLGEFASFNDYGYQADQSQGVKKREGFVRYSSTSPFVFANENIRRVKTEGTSRNYARFCDELFDTINKPIENIINDNNDARQTSVVLALTTLDPFLYI